MLGFGAHGAPYFPGFEIVIAIGFEKTFDTDFDSDPDFIVGVICP